MLNKVQLIGNLGADVETRTANGGTVVGNIRLATNERVKKGDSWEDHTEWHRVVVFGKTAENAARFLRKGSKVYVEGKLRTNKWKDKEGVDRYTTEIVAHDLKFLDKRDGGDSGSGGHGGGYEGGGSRSGPDDDIPF